MIQLQFLNKLLDLSDPSLITTNNINVDYFSEYKNEFNYIKNHLDNYGKIPDKATFFTQFPDFTNIIVNEEPSYLLDELYKDRDSRLTAEYFNAVRKSTISGNIYDAKRLIKELDEQLSRSRRLETVDLLQNTEERYNAYVERCENYDKYYVKTGFPELDNIIGGWDRQEELAIIVARTNQGKTWMMLKCIVAAIEQGLRVGLYSGEMSERKVGYRIDTLISHISNSGIIHGNKNLQYSYKNYLDNLKTKYPNACLKVLTPAMIDGPAGVSALRSFIEKDNLDILFIDQHSLLEDDRKGRTPVEKAANISKDLKNLQVIKKIPIIAVSQQNREKSEDGPDMTNIAQSDRIGQDSTVALFFEQDKDHQIITMSLMKSRDSVNMKKLQYKFDFDKGIFIYVPGEDESDNENCQNLRDEYDRIDIEQDTF